MTIEGQPAIGDGVTAEQIRLHLQRVVSSRVFAQSSRMSRFLQHVVNATLASEPAHLKETSIGVSVFDRPPDYDPKIDPVVRNEARRLRRKLEEFYATDGSGESLRLTIPRGGYAVLFEAVQAPEPAVVVPAPPVAELQVKIVPRRKISGIAAAIVALVAITVGVAFWLRPKPVTTQWIGQSRFRALTTLPSREVHPAISPDGSRILYSSDQNGSYDIYVSTLEGQATRLTSSSADELHPAWSPDGKMFAFVRSTGDRFDVVVNPIEGGAERIVGQVEKLDFGVTNEDVLLRQGSPGPVWSPISETLAFTSGVDGLPGRPIHVLDLRSKRRQVLTHPPEGSHDFYPTYSPDGKSIAFSRLHSNSTSSLYVIAASGGQERQVTQDNLAIHGLAWMPDARSLLISSNQAGPQGLWQVDLSSGDKRPVTTTGISARDPSVSHDAKTIAYSDYGLRTEIWKTLLDTGGQSSLLPSTRQEHSARYSPDGRSVAFVSDRSGAWEIWVSSADGSSARQLTHLEGALLGTPNWSPDSQSIAFDARPHGHSSIYVIPASGGMPRLLDENSYEDKMPSWSQDGKQIYFNSNRGGSQQLWKIAAFGGKATRISSEFAMDSAEAPDGRTVYFLGKNTRIWQAPADGGNAQPVSALQEFATRRHWSVGPRGILLYGVQAGKPGLWFYDFAYRHVQRRGDIPPDALLDFPGLSFSPDESSLLYSRRREFQSDIILIRAKDQ